MVIYILIPFTSCFTDEPAILHVNRFSSKLVHRHIICSLILLIKQLIMGVHMEMLDSFMLVKVLKGLSLTI